MRKSLYGLLFFVGCFLLASCNDNTSPTSNTPTYPYDGVWKLSLSYGNPVCGAGYMTTSGNVAVASGAFKYTGTVLIAATTKCGGGSGTRTIAGKISSTGVVTGSITVENYSFAGTCTNTNSCTASGSNVDNFTLTR